MFKFDEQKYLTFSLHQAKANFYNIRKEFMSNTEYMDKFNNVVDITIAYNRQLHDHASTDIATETAHAGVDYDTLTAPHQSIVHENAKDMYLAFAFLCQIYRKRHGRLLEELENDYTKGNSKYPTNVVTTYRMISEYKICQPRSSVPEPDRFAFAQTRTRG